MKDANHLSGSSGRMKSGMQDIIHQINSLCSFLPERAEGGAGGIPSEVFIRHGWRGPELVFRLNRCWCRLRKERAGGGATTDRFWAGSVASGFPAELPIAVETRKGRQFGGGIAAHRVQAARRSRRRRLAVAGTLVCLLAIGTSSGYWKVARQAAGDGLQSDPALSRASAGQVYGMLGNLLSRLVYCCVPSSGMRESFLSEQDFIRSEMKVLMHEFGAEEYSVPPEFVAEVNRFVRQFRERDRPLMIRTLAGGRRHFEQMRKILSRDNLPVDLAYMALIESGMSESSTSSEGAAGFWQFTPETARDYGMEVSESLDERLDLAKSTEAASRYIRNLILDFGAGSSVMLAIAAYNSGPEKVRRAVRSVKDPIKQRNFWYLYQTRALPEETRDYVPKVFAAMLIGRNPGRFGFPTADAD